MFASEPGSGGPDKMSDTTALMSNFDREILEPGTMVDVCVSFDGSWSRGFEVAEALEDGYLLRRLSDGSQLPGIFPAEDIRRARRKQGLWWY